MLALIFLLLAGSAAVAQPDASAFVVTPTGSTTPQTLAAIAAMANAVQPASTANVLAFGADPTGTTDSTTAIRAAVATGKFVWVPVGSEQWRHIDRDGDR
jgi:hypothetical protein